MQTHRSNWLSILLVALLCIATFTTTTLAKEQQQLRAHGQPVQPSSSQQKAQITHSNNERNLLFSWFFGDDNDNNNNNNNNNANSIEGDSSVQDSGSSNSGGGGGGFLSGIADVWNEVFGTGDDSGNGGDDANDNNDGGDDPDSDSPFSFIQDILDPIADAANRTRDSESPLRDFFADLLGQPGSETPVQDWIDEVFNSDDSPFMNWIANLFNSTNGSTPIQDFLEDLIDGSRNPLQDAINTWLGGLQDGFLQETDPLNCSAANANGDLASTKNAALLPCAYNMDGDAGVWVCRTIYNPLNGSAMSDTYCANPLYTWSTIEECGFCPDDIPTSCPCSCDWKLTGDGARVVVNDAFGGEPQEQCVNAAWATGAVHRFGGLSCVTDCAE